jgi:hypothetical protein
MPPPRDLDALGKRLVELEEDHDALRARTKELARLTVFTARQAGETATLRHACVYLRGQARDTFAAAFQRYKEESAARKDGAAEPEGDFLTWKYIFWAGLVEWSQTTAAAHPEAAAEPAGMPGASSGGASVSGGRPTLLEAARILAGLPPREALDHVTWHGDGTPSTGERPWAATLAFQLTPTGLQARALLLGPLLPLWRKAGGGAADVVCAPDRYADRALTRSAAEWAGVPPKGRGKGGKGGQGGKGGSAPAQAKRRSPDPGPGRGARPRR